MEEQVSTPTVAPEVATPTADVPDSQGSEAQINTETPTEAPTESAEKMIPIPAKKWREMNQQIREAKALKQQYSQPVAPQHTTPPASTDPAIDPQVTQQIAAAVRAELAPDLASLSQLSEMQQEKAIEEISSKPYADELSGDIARFYVADELQHLPVRQRMEQAYKLAIGENIEKIVSSSQTGGYNAAYQKLSEKQSAEGVHSQGARRQDTSDYSPDDIRTMSPAEYGKNRDRIFEQLGLGRPD